MEKRKAYAYYEERSGRELQVEMGKRLNFPSHLHGELELFLVQSGCVCVGIDGEFRELKAVCGTSLLGDYFPSLTQCRPRRPYLCGKALDPDVLYALHSLYRCRCTGADSSISRALLHLILAHVLPELSLEPAPEPKAMDLTSSVVRYIMRNFRQPLSLEHIAKELGVSKYHLSHVFSARLHTSFREYVNALRLDCARDLLAATELSMLEVSMESGFDSLRTFNRVFQERFRQHRRPVGRTGRAAAQRRITPCALGKKAMALEVF